MAYKVIIYNRDGTIFGVEHRSTEEYLKQSKRFWKHAGKRIEVTGSADVPNCLSDRAFEKLTGLKSRIRIKTGLPIEKELNRIAGF
jgi:hypothetical protein